MATDVVRERMWWDWRTLLEGFSGGEPVRDPTYLVMMGTERD